MKKNINSEIQIIQSLEPLAALRFLSNEYNQDVFFLTNFQAKDQVITHMIADEKLPIRIFSLDTGRVFQESYDVQQRTFEKYGLPITTYYPDSNEIAKFISINGPNSFYNSVQNRKECCRLRKIDPLKVGLKKAQILIIGNKLDLLQNINCNQLLEYDRSNQLYIINPLFNWKFEKIMEYIKEHNIPYNSLHDKGFFNIGCAPCSSYSKPDEDIQSSMWWWEIENEREAKKSEQKQEYIQSVRNESKFSDGFLNKEPIKILEHLDRLESESVYILREVASQFNNPILLFSGGKDSITILHLAIKAFSPIKIPFKLVHIDTGHNFPEALQFRDYLIKRYNLDLEIEYVQESIDKGKAVEEMGKFPSRNAIQTVSLLNAIDRLKADACIGGARRDEEKARAKERIFSVRDVYGSWDPRLQRPELWDLYNGRIHHGENVRVFPISNWTELDVWDYINRENIELPSLYFSHERDIIWRDGLIFPISEFIKIDHEDKIERRKVRFRTVGDMTCTAAVDSNADSVEDIIEEIKSSNTTERGSRLDDKRSEAAMEERKRGGYF
jgi:sulfate adenylyltransferase subunit 2